MSVRILSASIQGIDAHLVEVEVDSSSGIHSFTIVGLADKAVQESEDRVASAIRNSGLAPASAKNKKILVNLAPADLKKEGPAYDLPIAIGYLLETKQIKFDPNHIFFIGELSLNGTLKHTNGVLATALLAKESGARIVIVPDTNASEAAVVDGISVIGVKTLAQALGYLNGTIHISPTSRPPAGHSKAYSGDSFLHIRGQHTAKRALIVAAAGGHNVLMSGPPGSGKSLLAKALSELLPPLNFREAIEVTKIYSSVGLTGSGAALATARPFRNPHHTTSPAAIIGGGSWPRPGEISLAHRGVLFLDELPEFQRNVLESLRQPLEEGTVTIARAAGSLRLPAQFSLVAAMNPCPCGNWGSPVGECVCSPYNVIKYQRKVSGPLLDRIDIQINVPRETHTPRPPEVPDRRAFEDIKKSIAHARAIQERRLSQFGLLTNAQIDFRRVDRLCKLSSKADSLLEQASHAKNLSLRACHKIKKLARTIADVAQSEEITQEHLAEAIGLRVNEQMFAEFG